MFDKSVRRAFLVIAAVWCVFVLWQTAEHFRTDRAVRESLRNRTVDISNTIGVLVRSQGRFGLVWGERLEQGLRELTESPELQAIALFNQSGEVVASSGNAESLDIADVTPPEQWWEGSYVDIMNLVDLGAESADGLTSASGPLVVVSPPRPGEGEEEDEEREGPPPPSPPRGEERRSTVSVQVSVTTVSVEGSERGVDGERPDRRGRDDREDRDRDRRTRRRPENFSFNRPFWMSEEQYAELQQKRGLHSFVFRLSTESYRAELARDRWLRVVLVLVALAAGVGAGLAWAGMRRTSRLQLRLVRSSEMNAHLREMNVAAAGLAHETRNPLNIVRAMAQVLARKPDLDADTREKAERIVGEVDRITGRLSEFIEYSRPREPRSEAVDLRALLAEVAGALETDREDKNASVEVEGAEAHVLADPALLRQVVFNLLLNALQAVGENGRVRLGIRESAAGFALHVDDDGPGVPSESREEVFRPYFSTNDSGAGLGLTVVRQIVLSHHWEIEYAESDLGGASFRVVGMRPAPRA